MGAGDGAGQPDDHGGRADNLAQGKSMPGFGLPVPHATNDPMAWMTAGAEAWSKGIEAWSQMLGQYSAAGEQKDRRFASPEWRDSPIFDTVRQSYLAISDKLLGTVEEIEGIDDAARDRLRFALFHLEGQSLTNILDDVEMKVLRDAQERYRTTTEIAKFLGISQPSVVRKLKKYTDIE